MEYDVSMGEDMLDEEEVNKYILFEIDEGKYAMHIKYITEIVSIESVTPVPGYPDFTRGVIDLRGATVPVIDFKRVLRCGSTDIDKKNYCIISDYNGNQYGILVDKVADITDFGEKGVDPSPKATEGYANNFVSGVARAGDKIVMVLDPTKVFNPAEIEKIFR